MELRIPCEAWIEKFAAFHREDLTEADQLALQQHLLKCSNCAAVYESYNLLDERLRTHTLAFPQFEQLPDLLPLLPEKEEKKDLANLEANPQMDLLVHCKISLLAHVPMKNWAEVALDRVDLSECAVEELASLVLTTIFSMVVMDDVTLTFPSSPSSLDEEGVVSIRARGFDPLPPFHLAHLSPTIEDRLYSALGELFGSLNVEHCAVGVLESPASQPALFDQPFQRPPDSPERGEFLSDVTPCCANCGASSLSSELLFSPSKKLSEQDTPVVQHFRENEKKTLPPKLKSFREAAKPSFSETMPFYKPFQRTVSCPECGELLPDATQYCANCGAGSLSSEIKLYLSKGRYEQYTLVRQHSPENGEMQPLEPFERASTLKLKPFRGEARISSANEILEHLNGPTEDKQERNTVVLSGSWRKVVEQKTPVTLPGVILPSAKRGTIDSTKPRLPSKKISPSSFFWLCLIGLLMLLLGGTFGTVNIFARNGQSFQNGPTLQAIPATIALGGMVTLRGAHFPGGVTIALSHDRQLPLLDTGGASTIQTDAHGFFSDTIIIDPSWSAGVHTLYATSTKTNQQVKTHILVTGQSALQGPPHLLLSSNTLDLGSGDETISTAKLLNLSNAGGGQVSWQASVSQSWLQISPKSGSIGAGSTMPTMVTVKRANLAPGSYVAKIVFTSNTEQVTLNVTMRVTSLQ